ncbi:hypothetical protein BsWGS_09957 [Bradybaena similaris]
MLVSRPSITKLERFTLRVIQCLRCLETGHITPELTAEEQNCRYCSEAHGYNDCPLAKQDNFFGKPNSNRKCTNCIGALELDFSGVPTSSNAENPRSQATLTYQYRKSESPQSTLL